jgi:proline-specific peptidase
MRTIVHQLRFIYPYAIALVACLVVILEPTIAQQEKPYSRHSTEPDIFSELQQNVWYLPTADSQSTLYVTELGEKGPPIVVLHGGPGNDFNYLVEPLRENLNNNKFILFDQRGSLLSPVPDSMIAKLSVNTLVDDLETLRQSLGEKKLILFGHSFGTFLAMAYYRKYPEHVGGLLLAASLPPFTTASFTLSDFAKEMRALQDEMRTRPEVKQVMQDEGIPLDTKQPLDAKQKSMRAKIDGRASFNIYQIKKWKEFQGGGIYYNAKVAQAIGNTMEETYDIRPTLTKIPIPIYVIQGDHDYVDPAGKRWSQLVQQHPSVHLSIVNNAGHYSWIDEPQLFQKYLVAGLSHVVTPVRK